MRNISDQVRIYDDGNIYVELDVNELRDGTVVEFPIPASFHPLPLTVQFWMDQYGEVQSKLVLIDEDGAEEVYLQDEDDVQDEDDFSGLN